MTVKSKCCNHFNSPDSLSPVLNYANYPNLNEIFDIFVIKDSEIFDIFGNKNNEVFDKSMINLLFFKELFVSLRYKY